MKHIKPGRGPSMLGAVMGVIIAIGGVLWTIGAASITSSMGSSPFGDTMPVIFPLFGVIFVVVAIVIAVYNFKNATGKKRYSSFDIVDSAEEPDPLNERFGSPSPKDAPSGEAAFCPYCGNKIDGDYVYCNRCGKRLPEGK